MAMTFTGVETVQPSRGYLTHPLFPTSSCTALRLSSDWKANGSYGTVPTIVPATRQNSISRANASQFTRSSKCLKQRNLLGKSSVVEPTPLIEPLAVGDLTVQRSPKPVPIPISTGGTISGTLSPGPAGTGVNVDHRGSSALLGAAHA
jgi:hypothetical protein